MTLILTTVRQQLVTLLEFRASIVAWVSDMMLQISDSTGCNLYLLYGLLVLLIFMFVKHPFIKAILLTVLVGAVLVHVIPTYVSPYKVQKTATYIPPRAPRRIPFP